MKKFLPIVGLIIVVGIVIGAIVTLSGGKKSTSRSQVAESQTKAEVGQKAPDFETVDFSGNTVRLSQYLGKPVFIDFWASWCPPCVEEIPEIEKISKEFPDLVVLGIHRTETEGREIGASFAQGLGVTYTLLEDSNGEIYKIMTGGQRFMPYAVFVDKNGIVTDKKAGSKTAEEMRDKVSKII